MSQGPLQRYYTIGGYDIPRPMGSKATAGLCKTLSAKLPYQCRIRKSVVDTSKLISVKLKGCLLICLLVCKSLYVSAK